MTWTQAEDSPERWEALQADQKANEAKEEGIRLTKEQRDALEEYWDMARGATDFDAEKFTKLFDLFEGDEDTLNTVLEYIENRLSFYEQLGTATQEDMPTEWFAAGEQAAQGLADALEGGEKGAQDAAEGLEDSADKGLDGLTGDMTAAGRQAAQGLANGITSNAYRAYLAAQAMARDVGGAVQRTLEIKSPSHLMERYGEYTGEGPAEGIERSAGSVDRAMSRMLAAVTLPVANGYGGTASYSLPQQRWQQPAAAQGGAQPMINATIVMDKRVVGTMLAPVINDTIGAVVAAGRE